MPTAAARRHSRPRSARRIPHNAASGPISAIRYKPAGRTLEEFHQRRDYCRVLIGPLGSAKTTSSVFELTRLWEEAPIDPADGIRRARWAAIRNTYSDLVGTTIKDFLEMVEPLGIGTFHAAEMGKGAPVFKARYRASDGVMTHVEMHFLAFDLPQDVRKARGLRLSGAWFNEMKELSKDNVDMVMSRIGRFRPDLIRSQQAWYGAIGDSNAPDSDHWLAKLHKLWQQGRLTRWWFGVQPGGVIYRDGRFVDNPDAENMSNLAPEYYASMMEGKAEAWIRQNLGNEFVFYADGRPIHPDFNQQLHVADYELEALPGIPLGLGFDWGRTPAGVIFQRQPSGRIYVLDEMVTINTSARAFGRAFYRQLLNTKYEAYQYAATGDPSGDTPGQATDDTPIEMMSVEKITVLPAHTNVFSVRTEALDGLLRELIGGQPAILISPRCSTLIRGLAGAYMFKRVQVSGEERYHDQPVKSPESHVCEALHYGLMGAGEGVDLVSPEVEEQYAEIEAEYGGWHPDDRYFE